MGLRAVMHLLQVANHSPHLAGQTANALRCISEKNQHNYRMNSCSDASISNLAVSIDKLVASELSTLAQLYQFYLYDSSAREQQDVDDDGSFTLPSDLSAYMTTAGKSAMLIRVNGELAGFLLTEQVEIDSGPIDEYADLFILRRYRRQGIALEVVRRTLAEPPLARLLCVQRHDIDAQAFWTQAFAILPFRSVTAFDDPAVPWLHSYLINATN